MAKVKVVLNSKGVVELLKSDEVQKLLTSMATDIKNTAGPGHESETEVGRNRARAMVWTETFQAVRSESINHTLTRAIDAGRR